MSKTALEDAIRAKGNQSALADALGVTRQAVSNWMTRSQGISDWRVPRKHRQRVLEIAKEVRK